jgi:alpha-galactosidase/6-phospho-beta-glucosidase family protein
MFKKTFSKRLKGGFTLRDISERVSYLQGLSEGLNITEGSPQGKIISGILNVMNEMAEEITGIQQDFEEMRDYIQSVDDDLLDLEETVLEDDDYIELECRNCGEQLYIESDILDDEDVIEVTCKVSKAGIEPVPIGEVPEHCYLLIRMIKLYEKLTVQAVRTKSMETAIQALTLHPLINSYSLAKNLVNKYDKAYQGLFK